MRYDLERFALQQERRRGLTLGFMIGGFVGFWAGIVVGSHIFS